jgi:hypothetical protein
MLATSTAGGTHMSPRIATCGNAATCCTSDMVSAAGTPDFVVSSPMFT